MLGQLDWEGVVFTIPEVTWENVMETAQRLEGLHVTEGFFVTYTDDEGDRINVRNAQDLEEAIRWAQAQGVPCLCLHVPFASAESDSDDESWTEVDGSPHGAKPAIVLNPIAEAFQLNSQASTDEKGIAEEDMPEVHDHTEHTSIVDEPAADTEEEAPQPVEQTESQTKEDVRVETPPVLSIVEESEAVVSQEPPQEEEQDPREEEEEDLQEEEQESQADVKSPAPQVAPEVVDGKPSLMNHLPRDVLARVVASLTQAEEVNGRDILLHLCSDKTALMEVTNFLASPAMQNLIVQAAREEATGTGGALRAAATALLTADRDLLVGLNRIPNVEHVLTWIFRQFVVGDRQKRTSSQEEVEEPTVIARPHHRRVVCDGCSSNTELKEASVKTGCRSDRGEIVGIRYKSAVVDDFDLCEVCEASGQFQARAGPFLKIVDPVTAPDMILCVLPGAAAGLASQIESLDSSDMVAKEFLDFVKDRRQRASPQEQRSTSAPLSVATTVNEEIHAMENVSAPPAVPVISTPERRPSAPEIRCKHMLKTFEAPHSHFTCDVCMARQPARAVMHGCRICNFDVCFACNATGRFKVEVPPVAPAPPAAEPPVAAPPQAKFVSDVTLADGCVVRPGEHLIKTWRVRNTGKESWPAGTRIGHVGQDALGGPLGGVEVPLAAPGEAVNVSVPLVMPTHPGRYTSFWRMLTPHPQSSQFGHRFWVTVNVVSPPSSPARPMAFPGQIIRGPPPPPPPPQPSAPLMVLETEPLSDEMDATVAQMVDMFGVNDLEKIVRIVKEVNGDTSAAIDRLLADADL